MSIFIKLCSRVSTAIIILVMNFSVLFGEENINYEYKDMIKGEELAEVTIIEYASFTCSHCATFHKDVFPKLKKDFIDTGKVKFVYREVYFDAPGLWAGLLARCTNADKYFGIVDLLYKKQDKWSTGSSEEEILKELFSIGRQVGIPEEKIQQCMKNEKLALNMIEAFQKNTKLDAITATPSLVINGKLYKNLSYGDLKEELSKLLE
jgi:protein-disulfide isomerase